MNLLVLVGSQRAGSFNAQLADAAVAQLPSNVTVTRFDRLDQLPFYNEQTDAAGGFPALVGEFRAAVANADALLIATPEYNGTMSATVKNAIDIASRPRGAASIAGKPVAVIAASASPNAAQWAREATVRSLKVAGALPLEAHVGVGSAYDKDGRIADDELQGQLRDLMHELFEDKASAAA